MNQGNSSQDGHGPKKHGNILKALIKPFKKSKTKKEKPTK